MIKWIARLLQRCIYEAEKHDKAIEAQRELYEEVIGMQNKRHEGDDVDNIKLLMELQKKIKDGELQVVRHASVSGAKSGHTININHNLKILELREVNGKMSIEVM